MTHLARSHNDETGRRIITSLAHASGVERAVQLIRARHGEPLTLDDAARAAHMSRYHFLRVFSEVTGVTPGRFLAAIRAQEAKQLLMATDLSVTEIALRVGYNSLGTFTRIFTDSVGFPPDRFRRLAHRLETVPLDQLVRLLADDVEESDIGEPAFEIVDRDRFALIVAAIFPTLLPRSVPIECVCLIGSRPPVFRRKPAAGGRLLAAGLRPAATLADAVLMNNDYVEVGLLPTTRLAGSDSTRLVLRPQRAIEPPIVLAFPLILAEAVLGRQAHAISLGKPEM